MKKITNIDQTVVPRFTFNIENRSYHYGLITVGIDVIHQIIDYDNFYNSLGYTGEIRDTGMTFDEFIWLTYRKDNCTKSDACLQARLLEYLIKFSSSFRQRYKDQYENWLGVCQKQIAQNPTDCTTCFMHSGQHQNEYLICSDFEEKDSLS